MDQSTVRTTIEMLPLSKHGVRLPTTISLMESAVMTKSESTLKTTIHTKITKTDPATSTATEASTSDGSTSTSS